MWLPLTLVVLLEESRRMMAVGVRAIFLTIGIDIILRSNYKLKVSS